MPRRTSRLDVVAVGICLLVFGMLIAPVLGQRARELSNRAYCAANLRGILQSMNVYAADNEDCFPYIGGTSARTYNVNFKPSQVGDVKDAIANLYQEKTYLNDPLAPLWLLVLNNQIAPKQLICKSDPFIGEPSPITDKKTDKIFDGLRDAKADSYSVAYMWAQEKENKPVTIAPWWKDVVDSSLPIMSDAAPYLGRKAKPDELATQPATAPATRDEKVLVLGSADTQQVPPVNSPNHQWQGQNVAFSDAHVEFCHRADVGPNNDSIWTIVPGTSLDPIAPEAGDLGVTVLGHSPPYDIVMVPTRSAKGDFK